MPRASGLGGGAPASGWSSLSCREGGGGPAGGAAREAVSFPDGNRVESVGGSACTLPPASFCAEREERRWDPPRGLLEHDLTNRFGFGASVVAAGLV